MAAIPIEINVQRIHQPKTTVAAELFFTPATLAQPIVSKMADQM